LDAQINKFKGNKTTPVPKPSNPAPESKGSWSSALLDYIHHPERHAEDIYYQDSQLIAIRDKFPKALHHLLVMPKESIQNFSKLTKDHLPLLLEMKKRGETIVKEYV
jgi:aprataxin